METEKEDKEITINDDTDLFLWENDICIEMVFVKQLIRSKRMTFNKEDALKMAKAIIKHFN